MRATAVGVHVGDSEVPPPLAFFEEGFHFRAGGEGGLRDVLSVEK